MAETRTPQRASFMTRWWLHLSIGLLIGILGSYAVGSFSSDSSTPFSEQRENTSGHTLINPLLACGDDNLSHLTNGSVIELEKKTQALIADQKSKGTLTEGALYFRQLNGGPWFGVNQETFFTPGSLLKVPLVISIYAKAEKDPNFLNKTILFEGGASGATEHFASEQIKPGKAYTVENLVRAVLIHSDNDAALLLSKLIDKEELQATYKDLGIEAPSFGRDYKMSVRTYASFFRILYNATYLNQQLSEHLLNLLTQTTFSQGIMAGVPVGTTVAHKFGERQYGDEGTVQLHDCGIVYKDKPFLLCVMMRGKDYGMLANNIKEVSKLVYTLSE